MVAVIGAGLASGMGLVDAVRLANVAAGIVVGKMGTAGVTVGELQTGLVGAAQKAWLQRQREC